MAANRREALRAGGAFLVSAAVPWPVPAQGPAADDLARLLAGAVSLPDFEPLARERIPRMAYEYIVGGAADEITLRWNREAFDRIRLRPRVLVDVSDLDTRVRLFGQELPFPILLAPTAYHKLVHAEGELVTARGASRAGAAMVLSSFSTTAIEDVARQLTTPLWFQLYVQRDRGLTREMVRRAEAAGCRALCVTVDTPLTGARDREERAGFALPPGLSLPNLGVPASVARAGSSSDHQVREGDIFSAILDPTLTWKEIEWLRSFARVPVLLKGVLNPDDAARAAGEGVAGLIVSNHGARNLDTLPATIDALPAVADKVGGRLVLLVDGGIRRGTDVLKALALGAQAVLIGRPYLYGLGAAGEAGVARVVTILKSELEMAMALSGRRTLAEIDRTVLWP